MLRHNKQLVWQHASSKQLKDSLSSVYGNIDDMTSISYCGDGERFVDYTTLFVVIPCALDPLFKSLKLIAAEYKRGLVLSNVHIKVYM